MKETTARDEDALDKELRRLQEELEQLKRRGAYLARRSRGHRPPPAPRKRSSG